MLNPTFIISRLPSLVVVVVVVVIIVDVVFVVNDNKFLCLSDIVVPVLSLFLVCPETLLHVSHILSSRNTETRINKTVKLKFYV